LDWGLLRGLGFEGKAGQVQLVAGPDGRPVAAVGMGPAADVTPAVIRRSSAALARGVRRHRWLGSSLLDTVADGDDLAAAAQAHAEGILLGAYGYDAYKSDPEPNSLRKLSVVGAGRLREGAGTVSARDNSPSETGSAPSFSLPASSVDEAASVPRSVSGIGAGSDSTLPASAPAVAAGEVDAAALPVEPRSGLVVPSASNERGTSAVVVDSTIVPGRTEMDSAPSGVGGDSEQAATDSTTRPVTIYAAARHRLTVPRRTTGNLCEPDENGGAITDHKDTPGVLSTGAMSEEPVDLPARAPRGRVVTVTPVVHTANTKHLSG